MKMKRRLIGLLLVISLIVALFPGTVSAAGNDTEDVTTLEVDTRADGRDTAADSEERMDDDDMDDAVSAMSLTETVSGYCGGEGDGTNLTWTLDSDGVLTISGIGAMKDYINTHAP